PFQFSVLADGSYTLYARATDPVGNTGPAASRSFTVDTTPPPDTTAPQTTITKTIKKPRKHRIKVFFSSSEAGSHFQCKLDKKAFKPCTSPKSYRKLKPGKHKIKVRAIDTAGNADATPALTKIKILRRRR